MPHFCENNLFGAFSDWPVCRHPRLLRKSFLFEYISWLNQCPRRRVRFPAKHVSSSWINCHNFRRHSGAECVTKNDSISKNRGLRGEELSFFRLLSFPAQVGILGLLGASAYARRSSWFAGIGLSLTTRKSRGAMIKKTHKTCPYIDCGNAITVVLTFLRVANIFCPTFLLADYINLWNGDLTGDKTQGRSFDTGRMFETQLGGPIRDIRSTKDFGGQRLRLRCFMARNLRRSKCAKDRWP